MAQVSSSGPRSLPARLNHQTVPSQPLDRQPPAHVQQPMPKAKARTPPPAKSSQATATAKPMATLSAEWTPSPPSILQGCSSATLDNARYELSKYPRREHENEDGYFTKEKDNCKVFAVFDGHDGSRAVGFTSNYMAQLFDMPSWHKVVDNKESDDQLRHMLKEFFRATEDSFFQSIAWEIEKKEVYSALIPPVSLCVTACVN